jgi:Mrp family chromosome partitioning ATPase
MACQQEGLHVIAFISQKGGMGNTTLAIHLATAEEAKAAHPAVLVIDTALRSEGTTLTAALAANLISFRARRLLWRS